MTGGHVTGRLDLSGAHLAHELEFTDCVFEDMIDLRRARADKPLTWTRDSREARTAAIFADEFTSDASLTVSGVTVTGIISLHWARIREDLRLTASHLVPLGGQAVAAQDLRVGGTLFMDGPDFHAEGEVCLRSAHIEGQFNCRHGRFDNPSGRSIDADHLVVEGEVLLQGYHDDAPVPAHYGRREDFHSDGEVSLQWARIGRLRAGGGKFANPSGIALHADAMHARDGVCLNEGFEASAEVRMVGASIDGELCCTGGMFTNSSGYAFNAEQVKAEDVYLDHGFTACGQVRFTDADISRQLNATDGEFRNDRAGDYALNADGMTCDGEVYLNQGFRAAGTVSLTGAEIKGLLNCTRGSFRTPDGNALFADGLTTPGMVYLDQGFLAVGEARFARATVGRQLRCTNGTFDNQHGTALDLTGVICRGDIQLNSAGDRGYFRSTGKIVMRDARITRDLDFTNAQLHGGEGLDAHGIQVGGRLIWILDQRPEGAVDLSRAEISRLEDSPESWPPGKYTLAGFCPRSVDDQRYYSAEQRKAWLRQTDVYAPDAYQQLARAYRLAGKESGAQEILIASQQDREDKKRGHLPLRSRIWSRFIGLFAGYGYKLHRPFIALIVVGVIGGFVYWAAQHANLIFTVGAAHDPAIIRNNQASPHRDIPVFYPFPYSFQLLIPGLDLRETSYWLPDAAKNGWGLLMMIYTWMMIIFGWLLTTAVVAGVARLFRRR